MSLLTFLSAVLAMENPKLEQFKVRSNDGFELCVNQNISSFIGLLGEPLSKENMWAQYPKASCALYNCKFNGIECNYFDINNMVYSIYVDSKKYSIRDNGMGVGTSIKSIKKEYGEPEYEKEYFSPEKNKDMIQLRYSTYKADDPELFYIKDTMSCFYGVLFNIDAATKKCDSFVIYWNLEY